MKNRILLFIILLIYIILPILIYFFDILFNIKFYLLTIIGVLVFGLMKLFKVTNDYIGITQTSLIKSVKRNILFIIICIVAIIIIKLLSLERFIPNETLTFYIFYILVSCPIQEFLYRGVFGYFEKVMGYKWLWLIISSLCYAFVHIIYKDYLTCFVTFIIGIIWYLLYRKDYNLFGVCISHIVLGILTISLGIVN